MVTFLECDRTEVVQRRMLPLAIVEQFDVLENVRLGCRSNKGHWPGALPAGEAALGFSGSMVTSCSACGRHYRFESDGPKEYSPAEERARDKAKLYEMERRYIESITPGRR